MAENEQEKLEADLMQQEDDSLLEANETNIPLETEPTQEEVANEVDGAETTDDVNNTTECEQIEHDGHKQHENLEEIEIIPEKKDKDAGDVKEDGDGDDDEEEEELEEEMTNSIIDPNIMPQVDVAVLAKRKWQVKVYPLKPEDFTSGMISRVFMDSKESLLYLMTGKYPLGKGEMYIARRQECHKVVRSLQKLDSHFQEITIEIVKKDDTGVVEEKAAMRFNTKIVKTLFVEAGGPGPRGGPRSKNRRINPGKVVVKNLPEETTRNMLCVMFPFAQKVIYNNSESTACLVMKTRSTVFRCLTAFARIELGGNVLQFEKEMPQQNPSGRSSSPGKEKESSKVDESGDKSGSESKVNEEGKKDQKSPDKSEKKQLSLRDKRRRRRRNGQMDKFDRNEDFGDRSFKKEGTATNRSPRGRGRGGMQRSQNVRNNNSSDTTRNRVFNDRRMSGGGPNDSSDLAEKAAATKDMMFLQRQLNMAIKSQLSMLTQTQMAVEQSKRASTAVRLGTNFGFPDMPGNLGQKRSAVQADLVDNYDNNSFGRKRRRTRTKNKAQQDQAPQNRSTINEAPQNRSTINEAGQNRGAQNNAAQNRGAQNNAAQNRGAQNNAAQNRGAQSYAAQNRGAQNNAAQNRGAQLNSAQRRAAKHHAAQNSAAQSRSTLGSAQSSWYDNDYHRKESYNLQNMMDDAYGYSATDRSYAAGLGLGTGFGSSGQSTSYSDTAYGAGFGLGSSQQSSAYNDTAYGAGLGLGTYSNTSYGYRY